jgi:outer membrane lipoprotein-sorting protein
MNPFRMASSRRQLVLTGVLAGVFAFVFAAIPAFAAEDLDKVLARLDASAAKFKSAQAQIVWDNVQTKPIEDDDKQTGSAIFERKDGQMKVALHLKTLNGSPLEKDMVYADGVGKLYEARLKQLQVFQVGEKRSELETFLTLGFGGSGKDLAKNWNITYAGTEQASGVAATKLELTPRDASVAKTAPRVLLWIDMDKGVAVKQQRFASDASYVVFTYNDIRLNSKIPDDAFQIKTPSGTQTINH